MLTTSSLSTDREGKKKKRPPSHHTSRSLRSRFLQGNVERRLGTSQGILGIDLAITKLLRPLQQTIGQSYDRGNAVANTIIKKAYILETETKDSHQNYAIMN